MTFDFTLDFSDKREFPFTEQLWAKEFIDALEREIEVYGETQALKDRVIELSLTYNMRSRYTAYVAEAYAAETDAKEADVEEADMEFRI